MPKDAPLLNAWRCNPMGIALSYSGAETKPENGKMHVLKTMDASTVSLPYDGGEMPKSHVAEQMHQ
jgi:hypothetical protein